MPYFKEEFVTKYEQNHITKSDPGIKSQNTDIQTFHFESRSTQIKYIKSDPNKCTLPMPLIQKVFTG